MPYTIDEETLNPVNTPGFCSVSFLIATPLLHIGGHGFLQLPIIYFLVPSIFRPFNIPFSLFCQPSTETRLVN